MPLPLPCYRYWHANPCHGHPPARLLKLSFLQSCKPVSLCTPACQAHLPVPIPHGNRTKTPSLPFLRSLAHTCHPHFQQKTGFLHLVKQFSQAKPLSFPPFHHLRPLLLALSQRKAGPTTSSRILSPPRPGPTNPPNAPNLQASPHR